MELTALEQATQLINASRSPLIIIPERPSTDAIAGALGLLLALEKSGHNAKVVSPKFSLPPSHAFLPKSQAINHELTSLRDFIIQVSLDRAKLESLSYQIEGDKLNIHLTPKNGFFEERDITAASGQFAHDSIIVLDAPTLDRLGAIYKNNAEFFYHTPVLNIDHHPENERYGQVNLVDLVANSVSEIVFEVIRASGTELLDEQTATTLLTGIISKTKAFQNQGVTPRTLAIASHLVSAGARRDQIIDNLYQTKSVATLRLWGQALSKLQNTPDKQVVWTQISQADLRQSGATPEEAAGVLDELIINSPGAKWYALFIDFGQHTDVSLASATGQNNDRLPAELRPVSPQLYRGRMTGGATETKDKILSILS